MRVLLTGATGSIGRRVLPRLLARKQSVTVLALPETITPALRRSGARIVAGDVVNARSVAEALRNIDVVCHLAGAPLGSNWAQIARVNIDGTRRLIDASARAGVRRFVFASSSSVYAPHPFPALWPITENYPRRPSGGPQLAAYALGKIDGEDALRRTFWLNGRQFTIIRLPVTYGTGTRLANQLLAGEGALLRPAAPSVVPHIQWVYIDDAADALVLACLHPRAANQTFNVAGKEVFTLREVQDLVNRVFGHPARPHAAGFAPPRVARRLRLSIAKVHGALGFVPAVDLAEGLHRIATATGQAERGHRDGAGRAHVRGR